MAVLLPDGLGLASQLVQVVAHAEETGVYAPFSRHASERVGGKRVHRVHSVPLSWEGVDDRCATVARGGAGDRPPERTRHPWSDPKTDAVDGVAPLPASIV